MRTPSGAPPLLRQERPANSSPISAALLCNLRARLLASSPPKRPWTEERLERGRIWLTSHPREPTGSQPRYFTRCRLSTRPLDRGLTAYGHTNMAVSQSTAHTTGGIERSDQTVNLSHFAQLLGSQLGKGMFQNNGTCASKPVLTLPRAQERSSSRKGIAPSPHARSQPPTRRP